MIINEELLRNLYVIFAILALWGTLFIVFMGSKLVSIQDVLVSEKVTKRAWYILWACFAFVMLYRFILELSAGSWLDEIILTGTARSFAMQGHDLQGYTNPIITVPWGYGSMSYLYIACITPLIKLFGAELVVVRLPMFLLWTGTAVASVHHIHKYISSRVAWYVLFLLCCSPWFGSQACIALDAPMLLPMLVLGILCVDKAVRLKKSRFFYIAMLLFGLSYYTYALSIFVTTFTVLIYGIFLLVRKQITCSQLVLCAIIMIITGYFAIAGWFYTATGIMLPSVFQYPDISELTRYTDGVQPGITTFVINMFYMFFDTYITPCAFTYYVAAPPRSTYFSLTPTLILFFYGLLKKSWVKEDIPLHVGTLISMVLLQTVIYEGTGCRFTFWYPTAFLITAFTLLRMSKGARRAVLILLAAYMAVWTGLTTTLYTCRETDKGYSQIDMYRWGGLSKCLITAYTEYGEDYPFIVQSITNHEEYDMPYPTGAYSYTSWCVLYNAGLLDDTAEDIVHFNEYDQQRVIVPFMPEDYKPIPSGYSIVHNLMEIPETVDVLLETNSYTLIYSEDIWYTRQKVIIDGQQWASTKLRVEKLDYMEYYAHLFEDVMQP